MKRLTLRFDDGYMLVLCSHCPIDMHDCNNEVCLDFVIRHLAAYEDTGLTPEEIECMKCKIDSLRFPENHAVGFKWVAFDENNKKTYPPIDEPILISYNPYGYECEAEAIGWGYLRKGKNNTYYWSVIDTKGGRNWITPWIGRLSFAKGVRPEDYGANHVAFITHWARVEPYAPSTNNESEDYGWVIENGVNMSIAKTLTNGKRADYVHYDFDTIEEATEI